MYEDLLTKEQWKSIRQKFFSLHHDSRYSPGITATKKMIIEKIEGKITGDIDVDVFSAILLNVIFDWKSTKDSMIDLVRELILIYEEITGINLSEKIDLPPVGYKFDDSEVRRNYMNMVMLEHEMYQVEKEGTWTDYFHKTLLRSQRTIGF